MPLKLTSSGGEMEADVTAGNAEPGDASITAYGTATISATADGLVSITAVGPLNASGVNGVDVQVMALADALVNVHAAENASVSSLGWLAGSITAGGDASAYAGENFTGTLGAGQSASLLALGDVTGSNVSAGDVAALYAWGAAADVTVSGVDGAMLFAYANLLGTVNSSAGWAEAFSGGNAIVVSISAATDASVTALGDLEALRVSAAGGDANLFAGGDLEAVASAGGNLYSTSYGDTDASFTAGGDVMVFSLGQMTANVTAGNDARAAAWGDMQIDISAGHDIPLVWTLADLTGSTVTAGNHIGRVKSYGLIDASIAAGNLPVDDPLRDANYGRIDVVEAWGSIDGSITAEGGDGVIGTVRSGASVDAALSPSPTLLAENDRNVFGPIPSPNVPSLAPIRASLAGMYRQLQQGQAGALAARGGMTLQKNALVASLRQQTQGSFGDNRAAKAFFADLGLKIAADIQSAERAIQEALQKDHDAYVNAQKLTAAGWKAGVAAAEAMKHAAEMKLALAAADFGLAKDVAINAATQLQIAVTLARSEQMAQLNEAIAQRPGEWKQAANARRMDWLDRFDAGVSGWADAFSFGIYKYYRSLWGVQDWSATTEYRIGWWAGVVHSTLLGYGAGGHALRGGVWALRAAQAYTAFNSVYAFGNSTYHYFSGDFQWHHFFGFMPALGWAGRAARIAILGEQIAPGVMAVSRWGSGLQTGRWVMNGLPRRWNYILSGKWQWWGSNQYATFSSGNAFFVAGSRLRWPVGWGIDGVIKGLLGQRQYL